MRVKKSCLCLNLRQGTLLSITLDLIKIIISLSLLFVQLRNDQETTSISIVDLRTQMISAPKKIKLKFRGESTMSKLQFIVIFTGDVLRYSIVCITGLLMICKRWKAIYQGTYFWTKFFQSFLNVFSAILMVTLTQLPFTDMILSVISFALD